METIKKIYLLLLAFTYILCFYSCEDDKQIPMKSETNTKNPHAIPQNIALEYLNAFMMDENNEDGTRGIPDEREISNVLAIKYNDYLTRTSNEAISDSENLLYVANFKDERGYAILAADDRIPEKIIAIVDSGNMSPRLLRREIDSTLLRYPLLEGFPTEGEGFFSDSRYPGEIFMNPNTVDMYEPEEEDTLVGNLELACEDQFINAAPLDSANLTLKVIQDLSISYATASIQSYQSGSPEDFGNNIRIEITNSPWSISREVYPLLYKYKFWHQQSPFNDLYPTVRNCLIGHKKKKAAAGCFPLAIAKVMAYLKYPANFTYKGYTVDWNSLDNVSSNEGKLSASYLLRGISDGCNSRFFYRGTFTNPKKAKKYLKKNGFYNVEKHDYNFSRVKYMLDKKFPVIIFAYPKWHPFKSHAWNIDGYKCKVRTRTIRKYQGNVMVSESRQTETCNMVHCDFGLKDAQFAGYFVSGVFDLGDPNTVFDNWKDKNASNLDYNRNVRIITYNK